MAAYRWVPAGAAIVDAKSPGAVGPAAVPLQPGVTRVTTGGMLRVAGYWLLYATVGLLVVVMLVAGGGDLGSEDARSPIRSRTKVIGALNGMAIAVTVIGVLLAVYARPAWWTSLMLYGGGAGALVLGPWAAVRIARDLSGAPGRRARR